ncbi:hypothetical protein [Ruegeria arenilitoris]|uniref:hypothetical protein n=1 Tax=Ruegeria arenilitoris TaxID=1173585 RepID=UPI00147CAE1C|nr:hypothetical protein [Ruegeria arenilitoris]
MTHSTNVAHFEVAKVGTAVAVFLATAIGFAAGLHWPQDTFSPGASAEPMLEDWHGNVRRSHWAD